MTSVLVIYDGWANLTVLGAIAVILGPVVAMVIGHMFAASLAAYATVRRRSTKHELLMIARHESRFLLPIQQSRPSCKLWVLVDTSSGRVPRARRRSRHLCRADLC